MTSSNINDTSLDISWNASTDNVGVTGYNIYRDGVLLGNTTDLSYSDSGLTPLTTYLYTIRAYDAKGNISIDSDVLTATTAADTTPPSTPENIVLSKITATSIEILWNASTDNIGVTGYNIYRNGLLIDNTTGLNYHDTGLMPDTVYSYTVRAYDAAGNLSEDSITKTIVKAVKNCSRCISYRYSGQCR